jgi:hypothetical protein
MVLLKFFYYFNISIHLSNFRIWYTLTGNFGNLLPIDYWSKSLIRKYHNNSLNIKNNKKTSSNRNHLNGKNKPNLNEMRLSQTFSNSKFAKVILIVFEKFSPCRVAKNSNFFLVNNT